VTAEQPVVGALLGSVGSGGGDWKGAAEQLQLVAWVLLKRKANHPMTAEGIDTPDCRF
jgi:hypothetical protein